MDATSRRDCERLSVDIEDDVIFGFNEQREVLIEAPANIRKGIYDFDSIGCFSYVGGRETLIRHVGSIGRFCALASNIVAGQVEHPTNFLSPHPLFEGVFEWHQLYRYRQDNAEIIRKAQSEFMAGLTRRTAKITIGNDVWIGEGAFIRRGVTIGDGAIIASRAVVSTDVPPYAIYGGTPAKLIRMRFADDIIAELCRLQWWAYGLSALHGVDVTDVESAVVQIDKNITSGLAEIYRPPVVKISRDRRAYVLNPDPGQ